MLTRSHHFKPGLDAKGQGLAEYLIAVVLIGLVVFVALRQFGSSVQTQFRDATEQIDSAGSKESASGVRRSTGEAQSGGGQSSDADHRDAEEPAVPAAGEVPASHHSADDAVTGGADDEYTRAVSRLHRGVGDPQVEKQTVNEISVGPLFFVFLFVLLIAGGAFFFFRPRLKSKKKKKRRRKFSLGKRQAEDELMLWLGATLLLAAAYGGMHSDFVSSAFFLI